MSVTTPLQSSDDGADSLDILNGNFEAVEQLVADEVADLRNNDINAVQGDISTIEGDISTIQGDISTIEGDISTINGTIGGMQGDITDLEEALEETINDGAPLATTVVKGRSKLSVAPVDADEPIVIGDNDPRVTELVSVSSGASDEGKVAKLNAGGQLDKDFLEYKKDVQEFTADGTWTKPSFGTFALVELWGSGGSGASKLDTVSTYSVQATGGGGGEFYSFMVPLLALGDTETVTVGVGGSAVDNTNGLDGEDTTFGAHGTAKGGKGGVGSLNSETLEGGLGGTLGSNNFVELKKDDGATGGGSRIGAPSSYANAGTNNDFGSAGGGSAVYTLGTYSLNTAAAGGTSTKGGNGGAGAINGNATAGSQKGGGGGASVNYPTTSYLSGKGGDGFCRVTVF